ncbi:MAG TPA: hypothetical protein VN697_09805 [Tepidiformaceae bacterium]|nr:hypothetical protein [Tepidiformaceae bacterium]
MYECAVCSYLGLESRATASTVGLNTGLSSLVGRALEVFGEVPGGRSHIVVAVCPDHVVDIYRDRLPGVSMAWKLAEARR